MIGLIVPTSIYFAPYIKYYIDVLDDEGVEYEIISWDRELKGDKTGTVYKKASPLTANLFVKLYDFCLFSFFVRRVVRLKQIDKLVIFGPHISLFLGYFLRKNHLNNYIVDYRDISYEIFFKRYFSKILANSAMNVISSDGFKAVLPEGIKYTLNHNYSSNLRSLSRREFPRLNTNKVKISTIGGIRDYAQNVEIIEEFKNKKGFVVSFNGSGISELPLKNYVKANRINNVHFTGFYDKTEEFKFYSEATFINIYYPDIRTHSTAMSNRFYNALIYGRPMIVRKNSIQGDLVEEYNLGIVIETPVGLRDSISTYLQNFSATEFRTRCDLLLDEMDKQQAVFGKSFREFVND